MNFEEASKQLEEIIAKLESGTTLEEGLALFEKGEELAKVCSQHLERAKGKICVIRETLGKIVEEEMK